MGWSEALKVAVGDLPQVRLCEATGIRQERLSRLLSGARNARPTLDQVEAIEVAAGRPKGFVLALVGYASSEGAAAAERWLSTSAGADETILVAADEVARRATEGGAASSRRRGSAGRDEP